MTVLQQVRQQAGNLTFRDAIDWLIGVVPLALGYVVGVVWRVVRIIAAMFVVGFRRGSKIE